MGRPFDRFLLLGKGNGSVFYAQIEQGTRINTFDFENDCLVACPSRYGGWWSGGVDRFCVFLFRIPLKKFSTKKFHWELRESGMTKSLETSEIVFFVLFCETAFRMIPLFVLNINCSDSFLCKMYVSHCFLETEQIFVSMNLLFLKVLK
ncbi:hypothetical protein CEXT_395571 [Caerostris extrusa]|uniref:Uncharacterized protein n=1 Tax=Caerostris extrusa TaxID=172846 RepID=A0AAV4Y7H7_CAEEX|nr:hypothetical protein CEXT_395571 [Caerostris extrusa]